MNGAILLLLSIRTPNFRPRFQYFNKWTGAVGMVVPLVTMFGIDARMALIMMGVFLVLVTGYAFFGPPTTFGEVSQAVIFHQVRESGLADGRYSNSPLQVRKYLLLLGEREVTRGSTNRFWRPSPLFLSTQSPDFLTNNDINLLTVANAMKKGNSEACFPARLHY